MSRSAALLADQLRLKAVSSGKVSPLHLVVDSPEIQNWLSNNLTPAQSTELIECWAFKARHKQLPPPGDWRIWLGCTGRGTGKNLAFAKFLHAEAKANPGRAGFMAGRTRKEVIEVVIGHPESGVLTTQEPDNPCTFRQRRGVDRLEWANGAYAEVQTAEEPEGARGPHYSWGVADELATWKKTQGSDGLTLWDNLQFALRAKPGSGVVSQMIAATTPRPVELIRSLEKQAAEGDVVRMVTGTMLDNAANLDPMAVEYFLKQYKGTRLERQEIYGETLSDIDGAIITMDDLLEDWVDEPPEIARYMIGCDPALKTKKRSDKTGIIVTGRGTDDHLYAIENRTGKYTPQGWGSELVRLSQKYDNAPIVAEDNVIGDAIRDIIRGAVRPGEPQPRVLQRTATRSKAARAEPILAYHERHEAHLTGQETEMRVLADQLCLFTALQWEGEGSPDAADAYVLAGAELMLRQSQSWEALAVANA